MPPRKRKSVVREPTQRRALETVEAILGGASKVLASEDLDKVTTNRIAEAAGVSVASVYQYFSNKDAVIGALLDRELERIMAAFLAVLPMLDTLPLEQGIPIVIRAVLSACATDPWRRTTLYQTASRTGKLAQWLQTEETCAQHMSRHLAVRGDLRVRDPAMAGFLTVAMVFRVADAALQAPSDSPTLDRLSHELVDAVLQYLVRTGER